MGDEAAEEDVETAARKDRRDREEGGGEAEAAEAAEAARLPLRLRGSFS
jgi:hypothetical protein